MKALNELKEILGEVTDLQRVAELLSWDQETYMPAGGVESRASQLATVSQIAHQRFTSAEVGRLLERAESETAGLSADSDEASLIRVARRDYDYEVKLPSELVAEMARAQAEAQPVWAEARQQSSWKLFAHRMQITVDLARQVAEAYGYQDKPMDALIARSEPELSAAQVEGLFNQMKATIVPLVREIRERGKPIDGSLLDRSYDQQQQLDFSLRVVQKLGYDLERGRQDLTRHPFCVGFGPGDVRITTRVRDSLNDSCLFSSIHESGHAMYEQGVDPELDRTPLCQGASSGVHESQSRLWENCIGRSKPFWQHFYPQLRAAFPEALGKVEMEQFYTAVNSVRPSYIRVEADEVTYNLHIMLRTELENQLLEGSLAVEDVPEAWNTKLEEYLGLAAPPDADGCLQDIHWTFSILGSFVGYSLGNLIAAQIMERVRRELPELDQQVAEGQFAPLLQWLQTNLYRHGRKFTPPELVKRITGGEISAEPWRRYIEEKYRPLYGL